MPFAFVMLSFEREEVGIWDVWIEHLVLISSKKLSSLKPAVTAAAKDGSYCKRESEKLDRVKYGGVSQCGLD